jgi:DNA-binding FadR family transcriptional regulator
MKENSTNSESCVNLYETIADRLENDILSNSFGDSGKLPSEQTLGARCGVSRTVIREALKLLKARGLIESRNGSGSYVTKPDSNNVSELLRRMVIMDGITVHEIYEVREILEEASAERAAVHVTEEQLSEMADCLLKLRNRNISIRERREEDFKFHVLIAKASDNRLLMVLVQTMRNIFIEQIESGIYVEGSIDDAIRRHQKIFDALRQHDPQAARVAIQEHLTVSEEHYAIYSSRSHSIKPKE